MVDNNRHRRVKGQSVRTKRHKHNARQRDTGAADDGGAAENAARPTKTIVAHTRLNDSDSCHCHIPRHHRAQPHI